jgi:hypothetical protein
MLGIGPISSRSISGSPFKLVAVPLALAATATVSFAVNGRVGVFSQLHASIGVAFAVSAQLFVNQALSGTATITFGGTSLLRIAGKPIILSAIPVSYTLRASPDSYTLKAAPEPFMVRGVR